MTSRLIVSCIVLTSVIATTTNAQAPARRRLGDPPPTEGHGVLSVTPAPSLMPQSLKDLCDLSAVIVEGVVATIFPSRQLGPSQSSLETDALVNVTKVLKGPVGAHQQLVVSQLGGAKGNFSSTPTQYSLVRAGEKYILFLREDDRPNLPIQAQTTTRYIVTGIWAGLFFFENNRMQVRARVPESFRAQYEGLTLEQIETELLTLGCGL
jgi:hypothetical protein